MPVALVQRGQAVSVLDKHPPIRNRCLSLDRTRQARVPALPPIFRGNACQAAIGVSEDNALACLNWCAPYSPRHCDLPESECIQGQNVFDMICNGYAVPGI